MVICRSGYSARATPGVALNAAISMAAVAASGRCAICLRSMFNIGFPPAHCFSIARVIMAGLSAIVMHP
jgi:hypothetical protein